MKKLIATFLTCAILSFGFVLTANAQTGKHFHRNKTHKSYKHKEKNVYKKHRNAINIGIGSGIGALLGALFGGKKGALIGAGIGAGGAAVYSYKIKPKDKKKKRKYRNYYLRP